jgi:HD-GYP domain-containing protein (c-di-GMP phosphodiesterase class II)
MTPEENMARPNLPRGMACISRSLQAQLWVVMFMLVAMLLGTMMYTFYQLSLRKNDYLILNLAGRMRVTSQSLVDEARHYINLTSHSMVDMARNYADRSSEDKLRFQRYGETFRQQINLIDSIFSSLQSELIAPELGGGPDSPIQDTGFREEINSAAANWANYRASLMAAMQGGDGEPGLISGTRFIAERGDELIAANDKLVTDLQDVMEERLDSIRHFQLVSGALILLLLGSIAAAAHFRVLQPLQQTVEGFNRVARGNLGHQVAIHSDNEIGRMTHSFNRLSERLLALFHLTDSINRGKQLDETLDFILEEFPAFVPVNWVAVLFPAEGGNGYRLERMSGVPVPDLREGMVFSERSSDGNPDEALGRALKAGGLKSVLHLPLAAQRGGGIIIFAAGNERAYTAGHAEFLGNIAVQVGHVLERTVVMEGLVVSALQGFAKLAESRDPETGDHLMRMSLYSMFISEELGTAGPHAGKINSSYVRNIYRFAPMHDIGKVGVLDRILLKPGRLDEDERQIMECHPIIGAHALRECEAQMNALGHSIFRIGIEIAECHHEKWDGSGYPKGLAGESIPLSARIVAVADVFDALTSKRPYKAAWSVEQAIGAIVDGAGRHFDPEVVAAFHRAMPRVMEVYETYKYV